jgi:hypothetical protein
MAQADFSHQFLEAVARAGIAAGLTQIGVNHPYLSRAPAQGERPLLETILVGLALLVLGHLFGRGLADIDVGQPLEIGGSNLGVLKELWFEGCHGCAPAPSVPATGGKAAAVAAGLLHVELR